MASTDWYVCIESFVSADPELDFHGRKDVTRVRGDDPVYRRWPHYFALITSDDHTRVVEEAVAVPGRKRGE